MKTRSVLAGIALSAAVVACSGADTSMYVRNDSGASWLLSVPRSDQGYRSLWVVRVAPGADAFALSWDGGPDVTVAVRGLDCTVVGTFRAGEGDTMVVDAVPGLTARIENLGPPIGSRTTTPGVVDTEECDGELLQ